MEVAVNSATISEAYRQSIATPLVNAPETHRGRFFALMGDGDFEWSKKIP